MPRNENENHKQYDLVTIEVEEQIDDVLQRINLLHSAFVRVLLSTRLIEVLEADYEIGCIRFIVESKHTHPQMQGKVCIRYESCTPSRSSGRLNKN